MPVLPDACSSAAALQQRPGFFAAANPEALAGRDLDPEVLKNTPIWATIGIDDEANRLEQLSTVVARIRAANGDPQGAATWVRFVCFRVDTKA